jgi:HEAT repeat protein
VRKLLFIAVVLVAAATSQLASQEFSATVKPLPAVERFRQGTGLRVRLTVTKPSVAAFEDPGFVVVFENISDTPIDVNPYVRSNVYIYDEADRLVPPMLFAIADTVLVRVRADQLIRILPGQEWSVPVQPDHQSENDVGQWALYGSPQRNGEVRMMLRGGNYRARFVYLNSPGFYDVHDIPDIWEGREESDPVAFSVGAGAEDEIDAWQRESARAAAQREAAPMSVADAERQISSDDQSVVSTALDALHRWRSTSSIPTLVPLLHDSHAWKRTRAAQTILALGDARVRPVATRLLVDGDPAVRAHVVNWFAAHCLASELPLLEKHLDLTSLDGLAAMTGCASEAAFRRIRPFLDSPDRTTRARALGALTMLTFVGMEGTELSWQATPAEWDAWYRRRGRESREQWAIRQIRQDRPGASRAAAYLAALNQRRLLPELRRATAGSNAAVRVVAARAIAEFERAEGVALLKRELEHRAPGICAAAVAALNERTDHHFYFNFQNPAERAKAIATYRDIF